MADNFGPPTGDSEDSESVQSVVARPRVCRYHPGFWLASRFEPSLLADITNYPAEIREDVIASIVDACASSDGATTHGTDCRCRDCLLESLARAFGFRDTGAAALDVVHPSTILPRFFWYKHELLRCHGAAAVVTEASPPPSLASSEEVIEDDVIEEELIPEEPAGIDITEDVVKSKRQRVTVIRQQVGPESTGAGGASTESLQSTTDAFKASEAHANAFSSAIRDLQFRLNRHGFLADPKTYLGKGRGEELYDKNDSLFDEEECVPILNSGESSGEGSEDGAMNDDDMELIYQEGEHLFVMDDESEEEEEQVVFASRSNAGPRALLQCNYAKPSTIAPCPYNPRGWRQPSRRLPEPKLPKILRAFFQTLEYVIGQKRTQTLQRRVFDSYEFVSADPDNPSAHKLNDFGIEQVGSTINLIFQTALLSFLLPHRSDFSADSDPRFLKYLRPQRASAEGEQYEDPNYLPLGQPLVQLLKELSTRYISPYLPQTCDYYKNIWLTICEHTVSVAESREDSWLRSMSAFLNDSCGRCDSPTERQAAVKALLEERKDKWLTFLDGLDSKKLFVSIDQKLLCLRAMQQDECAEELQRILVDYMIDCLPANARAELDSSDNTSLEKQVNFLSATSWSVYARSLLLTGVAQWATPIEISEKEEDDEEEQLPAWVEALDGEVAAVLERVTYKLPAGLVAPTPPQTSVLDFFRNTCDVSALDASTGVTKRRRETMPAERAVSAPTVDTTLAAEAINDPSEKKKRTRVLVVDILQTHSTRLTDLQQAAPLSLPIPFGVAVQCAKHPLPEQGQQYTCHVMITLLHRFESLTKIDLELIRFDPNLPEECETELLNSLKPGATNFGELMHFTSLGDFLDQVHACHRLTVEGRTRSLVFAGFDHHTKSFGLLCFPLAYPQVSCDSSDKAKRCCQLDPRTLRRDDFISPDNATIKGRLSLLDFLSVQMWLQIYSETPPRATSLLLPLAFQNNGENTGETRVTAALARALMSGGDVQAEWKSMLDRYAYSQIQFLKHWIVHMKKLRISKQLDARVTWRSYGIPD